LVLPLLTNMENIREIYQTVAMFLSLGGLIAIGVGMFIYHSGFFLSKIRAIFGKSKINGIICTGFIVGAIMYGGSKGGIGWKVDFDEGLIDTGSYATNDTFCAKWNYEGSVIAASYVYVDYKENGDTNAWGRVCDTNWYNLGHCKVTELEHSWELQDATNYFYFVYSDFEPTPVVHTNGVYCFYVGKPLNTSPVHSNRYIAVRSHIKKDNRKIAPLPKDE